MFLLSNRLTHCKDRAKYTEKFLIGTIAGKTISRKLQLKNLTNIVELYQ